MSRTAKSDAKGKPIPYTAVFFLRFTLSILFTIHTLYFSYIRVPFRFGSMFTVNTLVTVDNAAVAGHLADCGSVVVVGGGPSCDLGTHVHSFRG